MVAVPSAGDRESDHITACLHSKLLATERPYCARCKTDRCVGECGVKSSPENKPVFGYATVEKRNLAYFSPCGELAFKQALYLE